MKSKDGELISGVAYTNEEYSMGFIEVRPYISFSPVSEPSAILPLLIGNGRVARDSTGIPTRVLNRECYRWLERQNTAFAAWVDLCCRCRRLGPSG